MMADWVPTSLRRKKRKERARRRVIQEWVELGDNSLLAEAEAIGRSQARCRADQKEAPRC